MKAAGVTEELQEIISFFSLNYSVAMNAFFLVLLIIKSKTMKYKVTKTACMASGSPASGGTSEKEATAANAELFVVNIRLAAMVVG